MEALERYQQTRRVVEDITADALTPISTEFGKLVYVASLWNVSSGRYGHAGLAARHSAEVVDQALRLCHEELFLRILEMPLERQEWDLRACVAATDGEFWSKLRRWRDVEYYRELIPSGLPEYLREIFIANARALLDLLLDEQSRLNPTVLPDMPPGR